MKELGEQWIEVIDGKKHMLKVVEQAKTINADVCGGCYFGVCGDICHDGALHVCGYGEGKCPLDNVDWVIKDLGILNEDGCLPSPWGGYPKIVRVGREGFCTYKVRFYLKHGRVYGFTLIEVTGNTRQEAIDAWNRRA